MTRALVVTAALLALAVPAALAAPPADKGKNKTPPASAAAPGQSEKNAAKKCKAERERLGAQAFMDKYGTNSNKKNAFGKCVSGQARKDADHADEAAEHEAKENAAKKCKAERAQIGLEAFRAKYGTNANKRNAFGKCVSKLAKKAMSS